MDIWSRGYSLARCSCPFRGGRRNRTGPTFIGKHRAGAQHIRKLTPAAAIGFAFGVSFSGCPISASCAAISGAVPVSARSVVDSPTLTWQVAEVRVRPKQFIYPGLLPRLALQRLVDRVVPALSLVFVSADMRPVRPASREPSLSPSHRPSARQCAASLRSRCRCPT